MKDLQRPLPPIEEPDPKFVHALRQPPLLYEEDSRPWTAHGMPVIWCIVLLLLGWYLHAGFTVTGRQWAFASAELFTNPRRGDRKRPSIGELLRRSVVAPLRSLYGKLPRTSLSKPRTAQPAAAIRPADVVKRTRIAKAPVGSVVPRKSPQRAPVAAIRKPEAAPSADPPPVLTNEQILKYKLMTQFASWRDFLLAARSGSRTARTVLDASAEHAAVQFTLTSDEFKRDLPLVRNLALSSAWVTHIVRMLRQTETFDGMLTVASPHGHRHNVPLTATTGLLNTVLGYETTPPAVRGQLELRRWILVHTRLDGAEQPSVLTTFRTQAPAAPAAVSLAAAAE